MTNYDTIKEQLDLFLALDNARDMINDGMKPFEMFEKIVQVLRQQFGADACAIFLTEDISHEELIIATGIPDDIAQIIGQKALDCKTPQVIEYMGLAHILGLQIVIDHTEQIVGSVFIANRTDPLTARAINLLTLAERQIDSTVIQARTLWHLTERHRELEAIYQIDHLRDNILSDESLFAQFASLIITHLNAVYCAIIVRDPEIDQLDTRAVIDKIGLTPYQMQELHHETSELQTLQPINSKNIPSHLNFVGVPLIVAGLHIGVVVIGRESLFRTYNYQLIHAIASQIDSAIATTRVAYQLAQRTRELEAIYRIDGIRDQEVDFDLMVQRVLGELCDTVYCDAGYIMLYSADEEAQLELRATTRNGVLNDSQYTHLIEDISKEALDREKIIIRNDPNAALHSLLATPLILNERVIGVFGAINSRKLHGFTDDDSRMLSAITSQVDTAVFERLERRRMRRVLSRSVDPKVLDVLLQKADDSLLAGERVELSVLFADLRGSTEWAERTEAEDLVKVLNTFLGSMTDVIFKYGGTLDKFVGDEVIALFGAPVIMADHARKVAQCALEMQQVHHQLQDEFAQQGYELPAMGIGISSGEVIAGEFGPPIRTDFTAMGRVVNLGSRLCSNAKGGEILINDSTYRMISSLCEVEALPAITLKGINDPVTVYLLKKVE